jgi:amino acid transporter
VIVLALLYAFLTFALQGAVPTRQLETNDNALAYIAQAVSGSALARYMVLAVALSAIGSTLAGVVGLARVLFRMGADGVLPGALARTHPTSRTPALATVVIALLVGIGVWVYTLGSASVQDSFAAIVSVDGLLFALYYGMTGLATAVYYRELALRSPGGLLRLVVLPLAAAAFLGFIVWESVPGLGGWTGRNMISLYVMLAIGAGVLLYARLRRSSGYFDLSREAFQVGRGPGAPSC